MYSPTTRGTCTTYRTVRAKWMWTCTAIPTREGTPCTRSSEYRSTNHATIPSTGAGTGVLEYTCTRYISIMPPYYCFCNEIPTTGMAIEYRYSSTYTCTTRAIHVYSFCTLYGHRQYCNTRELGSILQYIIYHGILESVLYLLLQ